MCFVFCVLCFVFCCDVMSCPKPIDGEQREDLVEAPSGATAQTFFFDKGAKDQSTHLIAYSLQGFPQDCWR